MRRNWVLPLVLAMGAALLAAPAAHAGDGYFTGQDLTSSVGAPAGQMEPSGWSSPWDLQRHVAYVSLDGHLVVASSAPGGAWTWTTASTTGGYVLGLLSSYSYSGDHSSHIIYRDDSTKHLMEVWSSEASPAWQTVDLTATGNGPLLQTDPHGYEQDGQQHIVFADADGALWQAVFAPGAGWRFVNLTALTGARAKGTFRGLASASSLGSDGEAIGYLGQDGYPHVLAGQGGRWTDQRVGAAITATDILTSMAFLRDGRLSRYVLRYVGTDIGLHEAAWTAADGWIDTNLAGALGSALYPTQGNDSYIWDADGSEHMFALISNSVIKEGVRTRDGRWFLWTDVATTNGLAPWVAAFAAPDDTVHGTESEFYVYYDANYHLIISDLTAPYQP